MPRVIHVVFQAPPSPQPIDLVPLAPNLHIPAPQDYQRNVFRPRTSYPADAKQEKCISDVGEEATPGLALDAAGLIPGEGTVVFCVKVAAATAAFFMASAKNATFGMVASSTSLALEPVQKQYWGRWLQLKIFFGRYLALALL